MHLVLFYCKACCVFVFERFSINRVCWCYYYQTCLNNNCFLCFTRLWAGSCKYLHIFSHIICDVRGRLQNRSNSVNLLLTFCTILPVFSCLFAPREYGYYPSQSDKTCKEKFKTVNKETHPCPDQGGANHIHFFTPARSDDWKYWRVLQLFKRTTKIYCSSQFLRCTEVWRRCRNELEVPSSEDTLQKHT